MRGLEGSGKRCGTEMSAFVVALGAGNSGLLEQRLIVSGIMAISRLDCVP